MPNHKKRMLGCLASHHTLIEQSYEQARVKQKTATNTANRLNKAMLQRIKLKRMKILF
jgi:hypothetical protein